MGINELRTVQWIAIVGSIASVISLVATWNSVARAPLIAAAVVLPVCTAALELWQHRLTVFYSGFRRYYRSFENSQNAAVLNSVKQEYLYLGITFASVLPSFREWYGSDERRANITLRLLLTDPDAVDVLGFQARYETGIWTPDQSLTTEQRARLDAIVTRTRESIASVLTTLAVLHNAESTIEVYFHRERLRKWMHVVDEKTIYVGVLHMGEDGFRAPVIELQRQANHRRLFEAYREEWESIYRTATRATLKKAVTP